MGHVSNLSALIEKLRRVKGDDSTASRIVDRYGGYVGRFKESAKSLGKLKDKQTSLDDLPKFCENLDADLKTRIAGFVEREMDQWQSNAKSFGETDGNWSNLKSELHTSAAEIYAVWEKSFRRGEGACANLKKGDDHPLVHEAMTKLAVFSKGREEIIKEAEGYLDAAAGLLSGSERDSDDRDIASALLKGADIAKALAKLNYAKGTDKRANAIAETWPRYVDAYKFAVKQLLQLKRWQFKLDKAGGRCRSQNSDLITEIAKPRTRPALRKSKSWRRR